MFDQDNFIVGFSAVTLLGYTLILIGIHIFIPHASVTKKIMGLSYTSIMLLHIHIPSLIHTNRNK